MGLFDRLKNQNNTERADINSVARLMKKNTEKTAYYLELESAVTDLFESKIGGIPYWEKGEEYPKDADGNFLSLLAQFKFENDPVFKDGLLQFFISNDKSGGINFDDIETPSGFKLVYREKIDKSITESDVLKIGIPVMPMDDDSFSPVKEECRVTLKNGTDYIKPSNYNFNACFKEAVRELTGEDIKDETPFDYFGNEAESFYKLFEEGKSKLFGYPSFAQEDSRTLIGNAEYFNTLLFQLDSELKNRFVMWGDSGQANFLMNDKALQNLDFSKILYYWDSF